jgi:hypothetical protein
MEQEKKEKLMNCSTLDELLDVEYGETGTESREQFDDGDHLPIMISGGI